MIQRLDEVVPEREFKLLKIDLEGSELRALRGAEKLLRTRRIRNVLFEINEAALRLGGSSSAELISFVESYGYRLSCIGRFGLQPLGAVKLGHNTNILASL